MGQVAWVFLENQVRRCPAGRTFLLAGLGSQTRKHGCMPGATNGRRGLRAKLLHRTQGVTAELIAATGDQLGGLDRRLACGKLRRLRRQQPGEKELRAKGLRAQEIKKLVLGGSDRGGNRSSNRGCPGASYAGRPSGSTWDRSSKSRRVAASSFDHHLLPRHCHRWEPPHNHRANDQSTIPTRCHAYLASPRH